jgi:RNA polymerase sigma-70 factor (ECF subfamily)
MTTESSITSLDERVLLKECKSGSLQSFEPLVKHHQSRLFKVAYHVLRDDRLSEEAVQITFVKAWQKLDKFNGECDFGTWLFRLCVNTSYDLIRSRQRKKEDPISNEADDEETYPLEHLPSSESSPADQSIREETKQMIMHALEKLPEDQRVTLILREMHGLDYREIAESMNCREGTVMSRLFHARRRMRQLLKNPLEKAKEV